MKRLIEWISRHWAKVAIAIAIVLLGGSKLKRRKKQTKVAGDLERVEIKRDLDPLSDANRQAKKTADDADQAADRNNGETKMTDQATRSGEKCTTRYRERRQKPARVPRAQATTRGN